ncbi:MAG TPA: DHH family phosphoesterase [Candidatus Thermoplasmatota archaeon]|nr:DHH family phosphoesterase [Candidatus Thermoplasmatota archaeon]
MAEDISQACQDAASLLLSLPSSRRVRVVSHYDADGIAAAGVLCTAVYRAGYEFHASLMRNPFTKGFDRLKSEHNELIVFSDMGSGQIETIESLGCKAIILDHHQYVTTQTSKNIIQINANLFGVDGNYEVSGATLSFLFATAVDSANEDLAPLALAGATGDKQFIGGVRGLNKNILQNALQKGFLTEQTRIKLYGETIADALYYSVDPYYPGISGKSEKIKTMLEQLHIQKTASLEEISSEAMMKIQSYLLFVLIKAGCQQNILDMTIRKRYVASQGWELERFADLLDACGKNGYRSLGLSLCLSDGTTWKEAVQVEKDYKQKLLDGLDGLEQGGIQETKGMRYFYSDNSSLGGVIAGIAMNYVLDEKKPLFSLTRKETDDEIHISCRGNQQLVSQGLDLGVAMKTVAGELGGYGGGHKIAAGATIAFGKEKEFLEKVDTLLVQQMQG